jgi:glycosyltransferase involved in cell wall biosynthesis
MRKLLYITDQEEYSDNGTISSLFDNHLRKYWDVDIVFITKYKHSFQRKGNHLIIPEKDRNQIITYLSTGSDPSQYDFVIVRNKKDVLANVLKHKDEFGYKVGYRISYPKKHHALETIKGYSPSAVYKRLLYKRKIAERDNLVNQCDLFLPSSPEAHQEFYPHIHTKSFPIWVGLDPDTIKHHEFTDAQKTIFVHAGSIGPLRNFDVVLDAFEAIKEDEWHLNIITKKKEYINTLMRLYPTIKNRITIHEAVYTVEELREEINKSDVGISLLPHLNFFDTVIADKVISYYDCAIPALMTNNSKNHAIFAEDEAFFSEFDTQEITKSLKALISMPREKLSEVGNNGQAKLLKLKRNYKILAHDLADTMDSLIENK